MTGRRILTAALASVMTVSLIAGSSLPVLADETDVQEVATLPEATEA